ncbi:MAG: hypothetical protein EXS14_03335 [Planctomycetes bacterium]|nr:hypothetical protein [Planctomycetota bacterium]
MSEDTGDMRFGIGMKLLLPVLLLSVFGLLAPLLDPRTPSKPRGAAAVVQGPRVPYSGELAPLLEDAALTADQRAALQELHQSLLDAQKTLGGITPAQTATVQQLLLRRR